MTGFLSDPRYLEHFAGAMHPERPERASFPFRHLETLSWFQQLKQYSPRLAEESWIAQVHDRGYLRRAREACANGEPYLDSMDVGIVPDSYDIACLAAGGALTLADAVMAGEVRNAFALIRPPGHHAEFNNAMGFCLLNNIAILARYLQSKHHVEKILILDWDVHHGNGTQHLFEEDPSIFYMSLHQYPFYPGTGAASEDGRGRGRGATLNCPLPHGAGDWDVEGVFVEKILPAIKVFAPDFILVSAGFDAHADDPIGGLALSTGFYGWMTERMMEAAEASATGRIISLLEGGYNIPALSECVATHLAVMAGISSEAASS